MSEPSGRDASVGASVNADYVLSQLDALPTLPAVALRVLQATASDEGGASELVKLIQGDQSISSRLLKAANSAAAGIAGGVKTLDRAVVMLGFRTVRMIALTTKIFECFGIGRTAAERGGFEPAELWQHALATACFARQIAANCPTVGVASEEAYAAGLLHDIGKAALAVVFPKAYDRAVRQADHARGDVADFERSILGVDHTVAGRSLAERWKLPSCLVEVIWLHHVASEALMPSITSGRLIAVVQLADTLAREHGVGYSGNHVFYEPSRLIAARLGIRAEAIEMAARTALSETAQQAALMGLRDVTTEEMYIRSLRRTNEELGRASEELLERQRRSDASARYFQAVSTFNEGLGGIAEFQQVVAGIARASATALRRRMLAFALHADGSSFDACWHDGESSNCVTRPAPPALADWACDPASLNGGGVVPAPEPVDALMSLGSRDTDEGRTWLLPIAKNGSILGGVLYNSPENEPQRLAGEVNELRSFASALATALDAARSYASGRRLAENLAESNRKLQALQLQLLRSRTLSMIAEMASGAAHELNSPLTVISGRAQMLSSRLDDPEMQRSLKLIQEKAHECSRIINDLMDFAQPRAPKLESVNIGELCASVRDAVLSESGMPPSQFSIEVAGGLPLIQADPAQLRVVLLELIGNARDALLERPGKLSINCRPQITDEVVEIIVRDTGAGMPPAVLQRAFDPFYSHRKAGRRRGLGLPRAHRIVEAHGGRIWLESRVDEGTTAHVLLPVAQKPGSNL